MAQTISRLVQAKEDSGEFYEALDKDPNDTTAQLAYAALRDKIRESLAGAGTSLDIYRRITGPLGLTFHNTNELLRRMTKAGFLRMVRL